MIFPIQDVSLASISNSAFRRCSLLAAVCNVASSVVIVAVMLFSLRIQHLDRRADLFRNTLQASRGTLDLRCIH